MTLRAFRRCNFRPESLERIEQCNEIIEGYEAEGLRLTLRQLYYQLVSRNIIRNEEKSYKALGKLVSDARLAGLMSWDAIEDRVRVPRRPGEFAGLVQLADAAVNAYRLPRWQGQENYVELWVEKDALAGVLAPIAREYHVTMMVNRGYSSQSAMYEAGLRFASESKTSIFELDPNAPKPKVKNRESIPIGARRISSDPPGVFARELHLLYLGDHDPSGEDMVRDVRERLEMFSGERIHVKKVALTMAQVDAYNPPPNPAKLSDSRAASYVAKHGDESWEVDAIPPNELAKIIRKALDQLVDRQLMDGIIAREEHDKVLLRKAVEKLGR